MTSGHVLNLLSSQLSFFFIFTFRKTVLWKTAFGVDRFLFREIYTKENIYIDKPSFFFLSEIHCIFLKGSICYGQTFLWDLLSL